MPIELYKRGNTWWFKGRIEELPEGEYYRQSTGKTKKKDALTYIAHFHQNEIRKYYTGEDEVFLFADAILLYDPTDDYKKYLEKVFPYIGHLEVSKITPKLVKDLGPQISPENSTDTWSKQIIGPVRAVINNAHQLGKCGAISIKNYSSIERVRQDKARGKNTRVKKIPGDWNWILAFKKHASPHMGILCQFMFETGSRLGQALAMIPSDLDLENRLVKIPAAKGFDERTKEISEDLTKELRDLPPRRPRATGKKGQHRPLLVFGYASRYSVNKTWDRVCERAGIDIRKPHAAGRHGFATETAVRQGVDPVSAAESGGWADKANFIKVYLHAEDSEAKTVEAMRTGRVQAEQQNQVNTLENKDD
ncbi:integrase [Pseudovibrio japonicus]|uniref:Integrase n=1 Tax=Pseudovibrio japonicus TaxID=366534 RepID=A0ABQ3E520_9HYPH|nr:tyrosine-type recombinase/integrase [Pseudovibrio japonicus]GHB26320.1 integrase [Pseudovibrio japonicus]